MSDENQKTILLVEDDPLIAINESRIIKNLGYNVIIEHSGENAVKTVDANILIHLIMMDIDLGDGMDGINAAGIILKSRDIPIIFLTSHIEKENLEKTEKINSYGFIAKNTEITVLDAAIKTAFKYFKINKKNQQTMDELEEYISALRESEIQLQSIFEIASVGIMQVDPNSFKLVRSNEKFSKITGYSIAELKNKSFPELTHPDDRAYDCELFSKTASGELPYYINEKRYIRKDGSVIWVRINAAFIRDSDGKPVRTVTVCEDISERKKAEEALKNSEMFLNSIIDQSPNSMWISDDKGTLIRINRACCDLFNTNPEETVNVYNLFTDNLIKEQGFSEKVESVFKKGIPVRFEINYNTAVLKNIKLEKPRGLILDTTIFPIKDQTGKVTNAVIQHIDITERKNYEKKIEELLQEKEIILKEVHHRIKNNILVIKNILALQLNNSENPEVVAAFQNTINRLQSAAVMYEKLNTGNSYKEVSLREYLSELIDNIYDIMKNGKPIIIEKKIDDFILDTKKLFTLGIIVNEMMTNALKYAFSNKDSGLIKIFVIKKGKDVALSFFDNGIGLPDIKAGENKNCLGMHLIDLLVKQMKGSFSIDRSTGTKFIINFEI